ncbi:MAG: hypothetical protein NVS1B4_03230 [Gemmatimonadaceae bacterium]
MVYVLRAGLPLRRRDTPSPAPVTAFSILILSHDVMSAALMGALIEAGGMTALYPRNDEGEREALMRSRPRAVLVDCDHGSACSDAFFGPATMAGARLILYGARDLQPELSLLADRHRASFLKMPVDAVGFADVLRSAIEG